MSRAVILTYGNCQADLLGACLDAFPGVKESYEIARFFDFVYPGTAGIKAPSEDLLDRCEALVLQVGLRRPEPEYVARLASAGAKIVRFPVLDCLPLWPQQCPDARNHAETAYPFGRYPYGDRVLLDLMDQGKSEAEIVDEYMTKDLASLFDLDRMLDYWRCCLEARDAQGDIRAATFVETEFRNQRLFFTRDHPSPALTQFVLGEVIRLIWGTGFPDAYIEFAASIPFDQYVAPVHLSVARALQLNWCGEDTLHRHWHSGFFTHREFARRYVRYEG